MDGPGAKLYTLISEGASRIWNSIIIVDIDEDYNHRRQISKGAPEKRLQFRPPLFEE
jgi:hypothetical protein